MPGKRITEQQIRLYMTSKNKGNTQQVASAKAGEIIGSLDNVLAEVVAAGYTEGDRQPGERAGVDRILSSIGHYKDSIHAQPNKDDPSRPNATCWDCHGKHDVFPMTSSDANVYRLTSPETCGRCHDDVNENFVTQLQHYDPMAHEVHPVLDVIHVAMIWLLRITLYLPTNSIRWCPP